MTTTILTCAVVVVVWAIISGVWELNAGRVPHEHNTLADRLIKAGREKGEK